MTRTSTAWCLALAVGALTACTQPPDASQSAATKAAPVGTASSAANTESQIEANLKRFDQLDFEAYSNRKDMELFKRLHCPDVKVVFPDGRVTTGIEAHLADMDNILFNGTPDSRITSHPIAFGSGEWTAATGVLEATFSEPRKT